MPGIPASVKCVARVTGLEPAASGVTGRRSNQLSYTRISRRFRYARPPRLSIQPQCDLAGEWTREFYRPSLHDIRQIGELVGDDGIEPPTLSV